MRLIFIFILVLFSGTFKAQASVNYQALSVEERAVDLKNLAEKNISQDNA